MLKRAREEKEEQCVNDLPVAVPRHENTRVCLHVVGLSHSITNAVFSDCAFTGKILRFQKMMLDQGFDIIHYGVEGAYQYAGVKYEDILSKHDWEELRAISYRDFHAQEHFANCGKFLTVDEAKQQMTSSNRASHEGLNNTDSKLNVEFCRQLKLRLLCNYKRGDIVCLPYGCAHESALEPSFLCVETGIGYTNSLHRFRIFESSAWMHYALAEREGKSGLGDNYWFVCPNYYNPEDWKFVRRVPHNMERTVVFMGRVNNSKGIQIVLDVAKRMPDFEFVICGPGFSDVKPESTNVSCIAPILGIERASFLGNALCCITPSIMIEPFCGVSVEAQLCGTPVIASAYGALMETVADGISGYRCNTLADYCIAIRAVHSISRLDTRTRACELFSTDAVGKMYTHALLSIRDLEVGSGWYESDSHKLF